MENFIVKIEVYTDYKEAVRELIGKYKLKNLNGFRITDTEPGGGCIVDGAYVKDIIKAELYMKGENRADIMQDILPMTENEKLLPIMSSLKSLIFQAFSNLLPHINRAKSDEQS